MTPEVFAAHRPRLLGVAYAVLGELGEAEDVVQDTWLRWRDADRDAVRNAEAFLVTTATRLAIDRLRSARARRETWTSRRPTRGRSPSARDHAGDATRRRPVDPRERQRLTVAFLLATQRGDVDQLRAILAADAIQYSDGGGNATVARTPIYGADKIARFYASVRRTGRLPADLTAQPVLINGDPGVRLVSASGGPYAITALELADDKVLAIRNFVNPERFGRFQ